MDKAALTTLRDEMVALAATHQEILDKVNSALAVINAELVRVPTISDVQAMLAAVASAKA